MKIHKDYVRADTHVHIKADYRGAKVIEPWQLIEELENYKIDGAVALMHSTPKEYEKTFFKVKKFCKGYSNLIPGVEITKPVPIKIGGLEFKVGCHTTYLGEMPDCEKYDINYGSWFSHVNKNGGLFFEARNLKIDSEFIDYSFPSIMESTSGIFDAINLKLNNHIALLGTDAHPSINSKYNFLGKNGILIKGDDFNYKSFIDALKNDSLGYFSQLGNNYYYITLEDFLNSKIIIQKL
jgi:hypothetical protein